MSMCLECRKEWCICNCIECNSHRSECNCHIFEGISKDEWITSEMFEPIDFIKETK